MRALTLEPRERFADVTAMRRELVPRATPRRETPAGGEPAVVGANTLPALDSVLTLEKDDADPSPVGPSLGTPLGERPRGRAPAVVATMSMVAVLGVAVAYLGSSGDEPSGEARPELIDAGLIDSVALTSGEPDAAAEPASRPADPPPDAAITPTPPPELAADVSDPSSAAAPAPRRRPRAPRPEPPVTPEPPRATATRRVDLRTEGYDSWTAATHVDAGRSRIDACVAGASLPAGGRASVRIRVAADGDYVSASAVGSAPAALVRCVDGALRRIRWSPPVGGADGVVTVTYLLIEPP